MEWSESNELNLVIPAEAGSRDLFPEEEVLPMSLHESVTYVYRLYRRLFFDYFLWASKESNNERTKGTNHGRRSNLDSRLRGNDGDLSRAPYRCHFERTRKWGPICMMGLKRAKKSCFQISPFGRNDTPSFPYMFLGNVSDTSCCWDTKITRLRSE